MNETIVSTTEIARHLGDYLARVKHRGERFLLTKNDQPVAELIPAAASRRATWGEIVDALAGSKADPAFADDLERVNGSDLPAANPWD